MCLSSSRVPTEEESSKIIKAWRIFRVEDGKLYSITQDIHTPRKPGKWLTSIEGPGFNAFLTREGARNYREGEAEAVFKVLIKQPTSFGTIYYNGKDSKAVTGKKMFIIGKAR